MKGFTQKRGEFIVTFGFLFACLFFNVTVGSVESIGSHIGTVGVFQKTPTNACTAVGKKAWIIFKVSLVISQQCFRYPVISLN